MSDDIKTQNDIARQDSLPRQGEPQAPSSVSGAPGLSSGAPVANVVITTATNPGLLSEKSIAVITAHRQELLDNFKFVWSEYMKWFTFFCMFNLVALGAVHTVGAPSGFSPLVSAFLTISIMSCGSSVYMCVYSKRVCRTLDKLSTDLCQNTVPTHESDRVSREISNTLPKPLTVWAASVNSLAIAIFIGIWTYISIHGVVASKK